MYSFLIDANLPYYFSIWNNESYIHQNDLGDTWTDEQIWIYAKENNLTIVTKDSDFTNRILFNQPPPKVIHIKIGNFKIKELFNFLNQNWGEILETNKQCKLTSVYIDRIEGIN